MKPGLNYISPKEGKSDVQEYIRWLNRTGATNSDRRLRMKRILSAAISAELTEAQRKCLLERYINGKKLQAIANELNINKSTVSRHISAAEKKLRRITGYCGELL